MTRLPKRTNEKFLEVIYRDIAQRGINGLKEVTDKMTEQCAFCNERRQTQILITEIMQDVTLTVTGSSLQI